MVLWFVGLGISDIDSLGADATKAIQTADAVYLDVFTSPMSSDCIQKLNDMASCRLKKAPRWMVEDGKQILAEAKSWFVVLLSYGDPYIATTHLELRVRAISEGIETDTIHAASSVPCLVGECGLHYYKLGRHITAVSDKTQSSSTYNEVYKNMIRGLHTVLLLEFDYEKNFFLDPGVALRNLLEVEKNKKNKVLEDSSFVIVASRVGSKGYDGDNGSKQGIVAGQVKSLMGMEGQFGGPPHTVVVPGTLHFTEKEAIKALSVCMDEPKGNTTKIEKTLDSMLSKYIPKARKALAEVSGLVNDQPNMMSIVENAELYLNDAEEFQRQNKEELAILSVGYAEGLIDCLRFTKGLDPWT